MDWNTTVPPKRKNKPIKLRYQDFRGNTNTGKFVWSDREHTFVECTDGPDGVGLYKEDGWKILGWKE